MSYEIGKVLNISKLNQPVHGQVITEDVYDGVALYSLAKDTDIPVQTNPNYHCFFLLSGKLNIFTRDRLSVLASREMIGGQAAVAPYGEAVGATVLEDSVAVEVILGKKLETDTVTPMEPFTVKDLLAYQPGRAVSHEVFRSGFIILDIMAFDMKTEISDIKPQGELILTGLEGEGIIVYNGRESVLHIGESFRVSKNSVFSIKTAETQFKVSQLTRIE